MRTPKLGLPSLIAILGLATVGLWIATHRAAFAKPTAGSSPTAQAHAPQSGSGSTTVPLTAAAASASPDAVGIFLGNKGPVTLADIPAGVFRTQLEALSPAARENALTRIADARIPLTQFNTLRTTQNGILYQICDSGPKAQASQPTPATDAIPVIHSIPSASHASPSPAPAVASVPISSPPIRHSKPGSTNVLYLDFNGQTISGTEWNAETWTGNSGPVATFNAVAYDIDGDRTTFNATEQAVIINVWERVAEDYQGFDIDVTTEAPSSFTTNHVGRALITRSTDANGRYVPGGADAGGIAFVDVFGKTGYASSFSPAWIIYDNLGIYNAGYIAEAVSHEFGHNLGLTHDGQTVTNGEYYFGHGTGETSWAPIMGAAYDKNVSTFSKGEYYLANNTQDDLAIIGAKLSAHADDYTDSFLTATTLNPPGTPTTGHIEASTDGDMFKVFSLDGIVAVDISPYRSSTNSYGGDLDVLAELYSSSGALLYTFNPDDTTTVSVTYSGDPDTYFIRVLATGSGDPFSSDPTGYTSYGSMGAYTITNSTVGDIAPTISQQPTGAVAATGSTVTLTTSATSTHLYYQWSKDGTAITGATSATLTLSSITSAQAGSYSCTVSNSGGSATTNSVDVTVYNATPQTFTVNPATTSTFPTLLSGPLTTAQWYYNGTALNNGDRSGRVTIIGASLRITNVISTDAGIYTLGFQAGGVTIPASSVGAVTLVVRTPPTLSVSSPLTSRLGASISPAIVVTGSNLTYIYSGLPTGLTYNPATGTIIGRPTAVGSATVRVTVIDAFGLSSSTGSFTLNLVALPSTLVGSFNGIVSRQSDLNQMLGNTISFSTTSNGQIRGQVFVGGTWVPFTGFLNGSNGSDATVSLTIPRNNLPNLLLTLTLPINGDPVTGTLAVEGKSAATIQAWNCPWTKANPATALAGAHVFTLEASAPGSGEADRPTGASFGWLAVATDGTVQWALQPSDGSALLKGTSVLGANGEVPLQAVQSNPNGSFLGWVKVWTGSTLPSSFGTVSWRHGAATVSGSKLPYPLGFGLTTAVDVAVETSRYTAPPKGKNIFGATTSNNTGIFFSGAGIESSDFGPRLVSTTAPYRFTLTNTNTAVFPAVGVANPVGFSVKIDPLTGSFTGSCTIVNTVSGRAVKRNVTFGGVFVFGEQGNGFFLLSPLAGGTPQAGSVYILPARFFP
jgi:hypothetical protein